MLLPAPDGPRGPLEQTMLGELRAAGLGSVAGVRGTFEGSLANMTDAEQSDITLRILHTLTFAVLRLAREVDELRAGLDD